MLPGTGRKRRCSIAALPEILGQQWQDDADYLETCRRERDTAEYDRAGVATEQDATELVTFCEELRQEVIDWLKQNHPALAPQKSN
jgi:hypothetical protein